MIWGNQMWNDAGTYDAVTRTGGANGSIMKSPLIEDNDVYPELAKAALQCDLALFAFFIVFLLPLMVTEVLKGKYPDLTYADIIQLAGVVAVEATGGPIVDFVPGRKDALASPEEANFPDATTDFKDWLSKFHQMGLTDEKDIVALIGGMTLGRAYKESLEREETSYVAPVVFDNSYFVNLPRAEARGFLISPSDRYLLRTPNFRRYINLYAKDKDVFLKDYAVTHKKFSEFGLPRIAADNVDQENNLLLRDNQYITIQKNVEKSDRCIHTLNFYDSEYIITSTRKPRAVNNWIERNVTKCSKIRDIVGIGPLWEAEAKGLPRVLGICSSTKKFLVYHVYPSGNHIPDKLCHFLKDEKFQKFTVLKWDKGKLKNIKNIKDLEYFSVSRLPSAQEPIKKHHPQMQSPITLTALAEIGLTLPSASGFEISEDVQLSDLKDPLDEEQVEASAIKSVLAFLMGVKYKKS